MTRCTRLRFTADALRRHTIPLGRIATLSPLRYLLPTKVTRAGPGSGVVAGGTLFLRLLAPGERGSSMACGLAGHRGEAWLKRGLLGS